MDSPGWWRGYVFIVLILCVLLVGCSSLQPSIHTASTPAATLNPAATPNPAATLNPVSTIHTVEVDILNNVKSYGYNSDASINQGLGGLWINWRYGTHPLQTNVNGTGETDSASGQSLRHDDLTDLRYLHNLWSYRSQNANDHRYDSELTRYTSIVKHEFGNSHNERGWIYDIFADIYRLSGDPFYSSVEMSLAQGYQKSFDPKVGSIYKKNTANPQGTYRVDNVLEAGCALLQAGTQFKNAQWLQMGRQTVDFVYAHAYISCYHTFPSQMSSVVLPDGRANPQEIFYAGRAAQGYAVYGNVLRMGNISQIIISLLDAYKATQEKAYLNRATDLLDALSLPANPLGLWDTAHGGYNYGLTFSGPSAEQPGSMKIDASRKEAGRQAIMLQALHLADELTSNRYAATEAQMRDVALHKIYYPAIHGVPYIVNADWSIQKFSNGTLNNMDTTEAMGAELESLFSLGNSS